MAIHTKQLLEVFYLYFWKFYTTSTWPTFYTKCSIMKTTGHTVMNLWLMKTNKKKDRTFLSQELYNTMKFNTMIIKVYYDHWNTIQRLRDIWKWFMLRKIPIGRRKILKTGIHIQTCKKLWDAHRRILLTIIETKNNKKTVLKCGKISQYIVKI